MPTRVWYNETMSEVLHADIFFFITGIAVIIFTALLSVALFHGIKVLKSLRRIMDRIDAGTEIIAEDMQQARAYITGDGFIKKLIMMMMGIKQTPSSAPKAKSSPQKQERQKTELKIKG